MFDEEYTSPSILRGERVKQAVTAGSADRSSRRRCGAWAWSGIRGSVINHIYSILVSNGFYALLEQCKHP